MNIEKIEEKTFEINSADITKIRYNKSNTYLNQSELHKTINLPIIINEAIEVENFNTFKNNNLKILENDKTIYKLDKIKSIDKNNDDAILQSNKLNIEEEINFNSNQIDYQFNSAVTSKEETKHKKPPIKASKYRRGSKDIEIDLKTQSSKDTKKLTLTAEYDVKLQ